ncbi:MAG: carbohydrate porin [Endomicrobium sp.]|nr:carbohydrate porin [Endomicrobium sp.]
MKRKVAAFLVASSLFVSADAFASDSVSQSLGIKTDLCGSFVLQSTPKANDGDDKGLSSASYLFDLKLTKEFEEYGKLLARFKGGRGNGLELGGSDDKGVNTLSKVNANADEAIEGEIEFAKVVELYYEQSILNSKLTIDFGKLNFWSFFTANKLADDDGTKFITGSFASDPIIDSVAQRTALRLKYALSDKFDISYAYFTTDQDHFDACGINIAQVDFKPSTNGNYRLYLWENNQVHYKYSDNASKTGSYGFGVSVDQVINENIGLFVRFGYKDKSAGFHVTDKDGNGVAPTAFVLPKSLSWSFGAQINGCVWARTKDTVGIALGQIYGSSDAKGHIATDGIYNGSNNGNYKDGAETALEVYYKFVINDYLALTPAIQYIASPRAGNVPDNGDNNVFVYGIRTVFNF